MKQLFYPYILIPLLFGCVNVDTAKLLQLEKRLTRLETRVKKVNKKQNRLSRFLDGAKR